MIIAANINGVLIGPPAAGEVRRARMIVGINKATCEPSTIQEAKKMYMSSTQPAVFVAKRRISQ